ncbi:MAG: GDP-mannose 4,6-dehydratase [Candidatus Cloacimonas sp. 4484_209]|nr:MAG: GDP-mannose 4,6-dehydratase [Candidatus Cloacimonas sp. 4484_209]
MKKALITGITGQDGSYLAELLLSKGYAVYGMVRRSSSFNTGRIDHLINNYSTDRFDFFRGDVTDINSLMSILKEVQPDEIYNLAAQSHVKVSFEIPVYTFETVANGTLKLLEAIRSLGLNCKIYQAGSSEMFGASPPPQNENTPFYPRSPYAAGKVAAYYLCVNYREAYNMWIANGILFNHESPRRGETFVTRKVTRAVARIKLGIQDKIYLGNLEAKRDWGYAPEYVEAMWLMLQQDEPEDYVIATGESHSVREFVELAFKFAGFDIIWDGEGLDERGIDARTGRVLIEIHPRYFRPTEPEFLLGDATKAREKLGWKPKVKFKELVNIMVEADLKRERMLLEGTRAFNEEWRTHI